MNSIEFYILFCIFNILLIGLILACYCLFAVLLVLDVEDIWFGVNVFCAFIFLIIYITLKLCLPKIIVNFSNKHNGSIINNFIEYLQSKKTNKTKILFLAFCFDLPFITLSIIGYPSLVLLIYFLFYAGGIFVFYIMLYQECEKNINKESFF
ncbi:MAG: hypothetical protein IKU37_03965 [Candidatus Gastranaerophilales bacterium]|nr:hypothetical protein [Candidatus Gastranaerophilales bacterium]